ncbi:MAG: hypothetical protein LQ352_002930 [Teloschistes flavicans]|nr:MAG: hypothetical protein LQ352_002930 [Teloschistes flavicans]
MWNPNQGKRIWSHGEDIRGRDKRLKLSPLRQQYNTEHRSPNSGSGTHHERPYGLTSPINHVSEDSDDTELARLEAELAQRKYVRAVRRDQRRAERSPMPQKHRPLPNAHAPPSNPRPHSSTVDGSAQHDAYSSSQIELEDGVLHGNTDIGHGAPRPTYSAQNNPSLGAYHDGPFENMLNQASTSQPNALEKTSQATSRIPAARQPYFQQASGQYASTRNMQSIGLESPYYSPTYYPTQSNLPPQSRKRGHEDNEASLETAEMTKRQKRLERSARQGKEIGTDNKEKGLVRFDQRGNMECCIENEWRPAVYHHDRRERLLEIAEQNGRLQYTYDQVHGLDALDRTAYHAEYANVNMKERLARPRILYLWNPPIDRPKAERDPGYMRDPDNKNLILIDKNNHPVKDHEELPVVISGQVPGLWMELWRRLNAYITNADIVARTPNTTCLGIGKKDHALTQQAFNNRTRRDRILLGTRAWSEREGSEAIQAQLKALMPERVLRELRENGSTMGWRDLTNEEITAVVSVNRGQGSALLRAGSRRLDERTKGERDAIANARNDAVLARLMREKRKEDEKDGLLRVEEAQDDGVEEEDVVEEESSFERGPSEGWSEIASDPPSGSDIDPAEMTQWNDTTLMESQYGEDDTVVQPEGLEKDGRLVGNDEKDGNGDDVADTGPDTTYLNQLFSTADETKTVDPASLINWFDSTGQANASTIDFPTFGRDQGNTAVEGIQLAGAIEEGLVHPSYFDAEIGANQHPIVATSEATNNDAATEESARPSQVKENLHAAQPQESQAEPELDFASFIDFDATLAMDQLLQDYIGEDLLSPEGNSEI